MSSILDILGTIMSLAGESSAATEEAQADQRASAYERAVREIERSNRERSERVQRRNQLMSAIGGKQRFLAPHMEETPKTPEGADLDVANALRSFGGLISSTGSSMGSMSNGENEPVSYSSGSTPRATSAINYEAPKEDDVRVAYNKPKTDASFATWG